MKAALNEKGVIQILPVIAIIVAIGVIAFILLAAVGPFKMTTFQNLYPKTPSHAATTGNGAPVGAHYDLNIIGVSKGKTVNITSGNRIFVPLYGKCSIDLQMGDFSVLDGNCTDGKALFQLPNPDPTNTGLTQYSVWVRALGKPKGTSTTQTCATDPTTGYTYCSAYTYVAFRSGGKQTFTDVSKTLLYVYADLTGSGQLQRYSLFDPALENYYWTYDNTGLKLLQMRFYPVSSNVNP